MDRGVWMLATWLVAKHGAEAPRLVHERIMHLRRELADERQILLWLTIDEAVHQWSRASTTRH